MMEVSSGKQVCWDSSSCTVLNKLQLQKSKRAVEFYTSNYNYKLELEFLNTPPWCLSHMFNQQGFFPFYYCFLCNWYHTKYITLNHYSKSFFHLDYINSSFYIGSVLLAWGTCHSCRLSNGFRDFFHCHGDGAVSYDRTHSIGFVDLSEDRAVVVGTEHARPQQPLDLLDGGGVTVTGVPHHTVDGVRHQSAKIYSCQYFIKIINRREMFRVLYFSHQYGRLIHWF